MQNLTRLNRNLVKILLSPKNRLVVAAVLVLTIVAYSCNSTSGSTPIAAAQAPALPVLTVAKIPATTYQDFSASIEGTKDIEIRPQVEGYIDRIYVDEGAHVKKGTVLFKINDQRYREELNNAKAILAAAEANLANAEINVGKLTPLVENNVVSDVQLKAATASKNAAKASVEQAAAMVQNASIRLGYTTIEAPVDGYIGRIPFKTGSLVGSATIEPLTVLSEVREVYAYFSLSEQDFMLFKNQYEGSSIEEKISKMPQVDLVLADNSVYPRKGKVEIASGQFNSSMGSITFRAAFENTEGLLRSGNTGRVRIPRSIQSALVVPQEATYELQDKVFVFVVADSNKVSSKPITITASSGNYYLVGNGLNAGDKIVYMGLDRLREGVAIVPEPISMDSLLRSRPL
jgi:membrane fusion protein (multidrug efflux system)